jgi:hypothetical protein
MTDVGLCKGRADVPGFAGECCTNVRLQPVGQGNRQDALPSPLHLKGHI